MTDQESVARGNTERVEFFLSAAGQWHFRRVGANNERMAQSEGYQNHADAFSTAGAIFKPVPWWERGADGKWRQVQMDEIEGTEEGEPTLDPQPDELQEGAPEDAEEGPEPTEAPVEE